MTARANSLTERVKPGRSGSPTVAGNDLRLLMDCLRRIGYDTDALAAGTSLASIDLSDPDSRFPCELYGTIICRAQEKRRIANLACEIARVTPIGAYPLLDYLVVTSETVGGGLRQLARYLHISSSPVVLQLDETADPIRVEMTCEAGPFGIEHLTSLAVLHFRRETDERFAACAVSFKHEPDDAAALERVLRCPVRSGASWNGVSIGLEAWHLPLKRRDPALRQLLESQAEAIAARLPSRSGIALDAQRVLASQVAGGETSIGALARQLAMSSRTLQRRLAEEGVSYQELLDEARKEAAGRYLNDSTLAISEVAYLIGYSEPAPFHRAFKRWYGTTPDAFRQRRRISP